ncbi:response regulator [Aliikangiella sp. G2MR2-5]|uniref:response regulator n=1 Tax=Aliikangiella sp. G2MR2-5 TaxID=2788943 RepID=UPI0018A95D3B|nr:response regulator [Aliikangiella sp. G2MR2-5]
MSLKFLIVDDSKAMQTIVQRTLSNAGYKDHDFKYADNGKEALEIIKHWQPDMVLLDWHMPEMTGIQVLEKVNELKLGTRIGFITAEKNESSLKRAKASGAMFVVNKPFTAETLKENLIPALSGASTLTNAFPHIKDLIFPSPAAMSTLLSTITSHVIKVEKVKPVSVNELELPCTIALFGDKDKKVKAIQILDSTSSDQLAEKFASSVFRGEPFDDKLLAKALLKALSIIAVCFYNVDKSAELRLLKTYNMQKMIKKVARLDKIPEEERLDLKFTFDDGSSSYSTICLESRGEAL